MPAAGYPFHRIRVRGIDRSNPLRALRALALAALALPRAAWILRRVRPDAVIGRRRLRGGAGGPRGGSGARAARAVRGGQPPRRVEPAARTLRQAGVPLVPARGAQRRPLRGERPAGARRHRQGGPRRGAPALRHRRGRALPARLRRLAGRALAQPGGGGGVRQGGAVRRAPRQRPARLPGPARALDALGSPAHYHLHPYIEPFADALAAADLVAARAGGSVLEVAAAGLPGGARALSARHGRPPDRQRPLDGAVGRRGGGPGRRARRPAAGARGGCAAGRSAAAALDVGRGRAGVAAGRGGADRPRDALAGR